LVGEEEFRGEHRVKAWLTSLAHWAFIQDYRTDAVVLEPRVDNERSDILPTSTLKNWWWLTEVIVQFYLAFKQIGISKRKGDHVSAQAERICEVEKGEL
jgi:Acetyltransferase (GNAT) domain